GGGVVAEEVLVIVTGQLALEEPADGKAALADVVLFVETGGDDADPLPPHPPTLENAERRVLTTESQRAQRRPRREPRMNTDETRIRAEKAKPSPLSAVFIRVRSVLLSFGICASRANSERPLTL